MNFRFTEAEERFRQELRAFLKREVTGELLREIHSEEGISTYTWEFLRKLGARGWLTPSWPEKYGGLGLSHTYTMIVGEELDSHRVLPPLVGAYMAGPTILEFGSEPQKSYYLPRIARGEIELALGYTEPQAGTDLASVEMRAVEVDGEFILNGQKMFSTGAHYSQYHWLLARTDRAAPKHEGLSLFLVNLKSPGITIRPLRVMGWEQTNEVFYDDVRVPMANLVGEKNQGWYYVVKALSDERVGLSPISGMERTVNDLAEYVRQTERNGQPLAQYPEVRHKLAQMRIEIEAARMLSYRITWLRNEGIAPGYHSDMLKVFAAELFQRLAQVGTEILGLRGQLKEGAKWVPLQGWIEHIYRSCVMYTFGGGSSEINRNIIAQRGLGLPVVD